MEQKKHELKKFEHIIKTLPDIVRTKLELSDFFKSIHEKMIQGLFFEEILDYVFTSLDSIIPYDRLGIALLENEENQIQLKWVKSKLDVNHLRKNYIATLEGSLLAIIQTHQPRVINDLQDYLLSHPSSDTTRLALQDGIRSSLTCPLFIDGHPLGVIFFSSAKTHTYENTHVEIFKEISNGLALIIQQGLAKKKESEMTSKEEIFRNTIHDLNNPLNIIQGTLDLIKKKAWYSQLSPESQKAINVLIRNSESMINLVHDLSTMNQLDSDQLPFQKTNVSLDSFLSEVINDSKVMAKPKNIIVTLKKKAHVPKDACFDTFRVREALDNLISNAIKYSKEATHVFINLDFDEKQKRLIFSVKDEGQGIPDSELDLLFKAYGKTSVRPTANEPSTGLGLSNVKRLIEFHHGEVFVESEVGKGSLFGFWIPYES
jgi:signal transduction histidine kinase